MFYKIIIQGKLYFANKASYDKLVKMILNRNEVYYKNLIVHKELEFLDDENFMIHIPRHVGNYTDKVWKNTVSLFENCAQFAISGRIFAWKIENGEILDEAVIEPTGDRSAVMYYQKGLKQIEHGEGAEAYQSFNLALEKYQRNPLAYERRAVVNMMQKNYVEAMEDFQKCIRLDDTIAEAHYGITKLLMREREYDEALGYAENCIKHSIALQSIHWQARRAKAEIHINNREFEKAAFELKLLAARKFSENNPNYAWKRADLFNYGYVLFKMEDYENALFFFEKSFKIPSGKDDIPEQKKLYYLGIAKQKCGKHGFISDIKKASEMGYEKAGKLLLELT